MSARDVIAARIFDQWRLRMSPQEADAILSALRDAGYAVVPRELPDGLVVNVSDISGEGLWAAFLAALDDAGP